MGIPSRHEKPRKLPESHVDIQFLQPATGDVIPASQPFTLVAQVFDRYTELIERPVEVFITYVDEVDPDTGSYREESLMLQSTGVTDGIWDDYEGTWIPKYLGEVTLTAVVTVASVLDSDTVRDVNVVCPRPLDDLSHIGEVMSQYVSPARDNCGSTFEELIIIDPDNDGNDAFGKFADLARAAGYEVLFANMTWDAPIGDNAAAQIFLPSIVGLYRTVTSNPENYPEGMTVRILMGMPINILYGSTDFTNDVVVGELNRLFIADGKPGVPLQEALPGFPDRYWTLEVADYLEPFNYHSHVKTMVVDGEAVIVAGYNLQTAYFGDDPKIDIGMKLSGEIAQETQVMFDGLWEGAKVCTAYDAGEEVCQEEIVTEITHPDTAQTPPVSGSGTNTFSLYRDYLNHTTEKAIYEAMAASQNQMYLMQDRVLGYNVETISYLGGIWDALKNGSTVHYIFNCDIVACLPNLTTYWSLKDRASDYDEANGHTTNLYDALQVKHLPFQLKSGLHSKSISIDGEMLIIGSMNMDFSSWGANLIQNLAEYDIAVDDTEATAQYDQYFGTEWDSGRYKSPIFPQGGSSGAQSARTTAPGVLAMLMPSTETTIQDLVAEAEPNSVIVLPEGLYEESVVITKPLHIIGLHGQNTIIEPPSGEPAFQISANNVSIYNLTVRNSITYGITLFDNVSSLDNIFIRKVMFDNNAAGGILIENVTLGNPISYIIENNSFIGGQYGVRINISEDQTLTSTLRNNLFYGQSSIPIKIDVTDGGVEYSYNLFNNCIRAVDGICPTDWYSGALSSISSEHNNLLNLDPGFSNPAERDYALQPNSAMVDAGDPTTVNEMGLDGYIPLRADIGAFETELVIDWPSASFQEADGQVVMETEHATWVLNRGSKAWLKQTSLSDYTGTAYLSAFPDLDSLFETPIKATNPNLQYTINFTTTGVYTVWLRGYAPNGAGDSVYLALENETIATTPMMLTGFAPRKWSWTNSDPQNGVATITVTEPGVYTLHLWQREDGLRLDRILMTTDSNYQPGGDGPLESERR